MFHVKQLIKKKMFHALGHGTSLLPYLIFFQIDQKDCDVCRRNAGDSGSLSDGCRSEFLELLSGFQPQAPHIVIVDPVGDLFVFQLENHARDGILPLRHAQPRRRKAAG